MILNNLSALYEEKGDYRARNEAASAIVRLAEQLDEPVDADAAQVLLQFGAIYERAGQPQAVAILYRLLHRSMTARTDMETDVRLGWLRLYARALTSAGQPADALTVYREALHVLDDSDEAQGAERLGLLAGAGSAAQSAGDLAAAEQALTEACAVAELSGQHDSKLAGVVYHNLALLYLQQRRTERYGEAERLMRHALVIADRTGQRLTSDYAEGLGLLAHVAEARADLEEADRLYHESIQTFDAAPDTGTGALAAFLTDWGFLSLKRRQPGEAIDVFQRAADLRASSDAPVLVRANALSNLATAHFKAGAFREAIRLYTRAIDLRHQSPELLAAAGITRSGGAVAGG